MQAPLAGLRVIEFTHMVMGPACGLALADLGADVIKVEPAGKGDQTRWLKGAGSGFFAMLNRNKRSFAADMRSPEGLAQVKALLRNADVLIENFRPGALDKLGLAYDVLRADNPRLIYCSCKGFLPGPYDHRVALDEVVQMMGGLAYMTGLPGRPLRAGSSVNDILGGTIAALGIVAAVEERHRTGQGKHVQSGLFETNAVLVAQHMAQAFIVGENPPPMGVKRPAWPIYDIFDCADGEQVFVGVVTDTQWQLFCQSFGLDALAADPALDTQEARPRCPRPGHPDGAGGAAPLQQGGADGPVRGARPAVRADRPSVGPVRGPAPERFRRPAAAYAGGWARDQSPGLSARARRRTARAATRLAETRRAQRRDSR